jgi:hypothetical protein
VFFLSRSMLPLVNVIGMRISPVHPHSSPLFMGVKRFPKNRCAMPLG